MNKFLQSCVVAAALSTMAVSAQAAYYTYSINDPWGSAAGGDIKNITTSYSSTAEIFSWEYTIDDINDGFWLVVSDGPNPKLGQSDEYAILYGDLANNNNILSAYQYNGANNSVSWNNPGNLLQQWNNVMTITSNNPDEKTISFSIDVSGINSQNLGNEWDGVQFGGGEKNQIGIWFHTSRGSQFSYDNSGKITGYSYKAQGYHDSNAQTVVEEPLDPNEIPAPNALLLLGLGLLGMTYTRRNKAA